MFDEIQSCVIHVKPWSFMVARNTDLTLEYGVLIVPRRAGSPSTLDRK